MMTHKRQKLLKNYIVIGGGIAGVCCAQELSRLTGTSDVKITIISVSNTLVESESVFVTDHLDEVTIFERTTESFAFRNPNIQIVKELVEHVDYTTKVIHLRGKETIAYDKLCICCGVRPKLLSSHPNIIGLRDSESVQQLTERLQSARRVVVIGNGGIALELIHELTFCDVEWIVKDNYIGSAFFDASASAFIMPSLLTRIANSDKLHEHSSHVSPTIVSHDEVCIQSVTTATAATTPSGFGLGPDWATKSGFGDLKRNVEREALGGDTMGALHIHYSQHVSAISDNHGKTWQSVFSDNFDNVNITSSVSASDYIAGIDDTYPLHLRTTNDEIIGCDFVISATGVIPCSGAFLSSSSSSSSAEPTSTTLTSIQTTSEGYIEVNDRMETSIPDVYAAGDCCVYTPAAVIEDLSRHYFQMRLWSQARSMGTYAAQCMCGEQSNYLLDAQFDLFAHVTRFFGHKVVMLGRYNAQGLGASVETVTKQIVVQQDGLSKDNSQHLRWSSSPDIATNANSKCDNMRKNTNDVTTNTNIPITPITTSPIEFWIRVTPNVEYIKLVVHYGRIVGALLIGNTDLEEVCENLILNRLDVSGLGVGILDPEIDIADYFD